MTCVQCTQKTGSIGFRLDVTAWKIDTHLAKPLEDPDNPSCEHDVRVAWFCSIECVAGYLADYV